MKNEIKFKKCCWCKKTKNVKKFSDSVNGVLFKQSYCKQCEREENRHKYFKKTVICERKQSYFLKRNYGISKEQYQEKIIAQNNSCEICKTHRSHFTKNFAVDHDHKTGKVRGLLCQNCNIALGALKDSLTLINNSLEYLKKYEENGQYSFSIEEYNEKIVPKEKSKGTILKKTSI